jgi:FkbM family methyltransferase
VSSVKPDSERIGGKPPGLTFRHSLARALLRLYPFRNGQGRLIDRSFLGRLRFDDDELTIRTSDGFDITVLPNDHIGRHLVLTGQFDRSILDVLLSIARPGDRVLDVGANIGYVSCGLLACLGDCRVASVEPQPDIFLLLQRNLRRVGGSRAVAIEAAVSDQTGEAVMRVDSTNRGASSIEAGHAGCGNGAAGPTILVPLITGEQLLARCGFDRLDLIKIDVEGHELAVLATLLPALEHYRPRAVLFEHWGPLDDPAAPIRSLFDSIRYELRGLVKSLNGWRLLPVAELGRRGRRAHDYLATPNPTPHIAISLPRMLALPGGAARLRHETTRGHRGTEWFVTLPRRF